MKLVIAEKPSVDHSIAAVLGTKQRKSGYLSETDTSFSGASAI